MISPSHSGGEEHDRVCMQGRAPGKGEVVVGELVLSELEASSC